MALANGGERERGIRSEALPENANYEDTGCHEHPRCLTCPLPQCVYENEHVKRETLQTEEHRDDQAVRIRRFDDRDRTQVRDHSPDRSRRGGTQKEEDGMIYVDALVRWGGDDAPRAFRNKLSCHMLADTHEELMAIARRIGLRPEWVQASGTYREHFDLTPSRRASAVVNGAAELTLSEMGWLLQERRAKEEETG